MPPKREKAVAAEAKKKNTEEAQEIVATLKRASQRDKISVGKSRKAVADAHMMERLFDSAKMDKITVSVEPKEMGAASKRQRKPEKDEANDNKRKCIEKTVTSSDSIHPEPAIAKSGIGSDGSSAGLTKSHGYGSGFNVKGSTERVNALPEKPRQTDRIASNSKPSDNDRSAKSGGNKPNVRHGRAHGSGYQYEIDCSTVADTVDPADLKRYLESQLKVDGRKNNLGNTMNVSCEGQKVVVKSKVYLPKKSLRFLSRNFLKKNWNIRCVSKDARSYEYKYVGAI